MKKPQFTNTQRCITKIEMTSQLLREISQYDLESLKEFVVTLLDSKMIYQNMENSLGDFLDIFRIFIKKKKEEHSEVLALLFQTELIQCSISIVLKLLKSRPLTESNNNQIALENINENSENEMILLTPPKFENLMKTVKCIYDFAIYLLEFENDNLKFLPLNQTIECLELLLNQRGTEDLENLYKDFHALRQEFAKKSKMLLLENKSRSSFLQFDFLVCSAKNLPITYKEDSPTPTLEDLFQSEDKKKFFPHVVSGEYNDWEQYFNNMFYLLKEVG
jgi:hypothetical protein